MRLKSSYHLSSLIIISLYLLHDLQNSTLSLTLKVFENFTLYLFFTIHFHYHCPSGVCCDFGINRNFSFWNLCLCISFYVCTTGNESNISIVLFCFPDDRNQTILPVVKSFCEKSFKADESILISLSFHLGKLCHGLYGRIYFKNFPIVDYFSVLFSSILATTYKALNCQTYPLNV